MLKPFLTTIRITEVSVMSSGKVYAGTCQPRWRGADVFLSLHNILPDRYPLVGFTLSEILALENYAGRLIDYGVMVPRIQALYAFAAADLDEPRLLGFVQDGLPAYAWTNDEDHPWTTSRSPRLRSVLRALTSS